MRVFGDLLNIIINCSKEALLDIDREPQTPLLNTTDPSKVPAVILPLFLVQELVFLDYLC